MTPAVLLVTDPRWPFARVEDVVAEAGQALPPGAFGVQLRDKALPPIDLARAAERLRAATSRFGARLFVNAPSADALRVARDVAADGVHVPCHAESILEARTLLGDAAWISTPSHSAAELAIAAVRGADAALVSPIFASPGKGMPRGVDALRDARTASALAVLALGGVDPSNARACAEAGAHGVAVVRALLESTDVARCARELFAPFAPGGHV